MKKAFLSILLTAMAISCMAQISGCQQRGQRIGFDIGYGFQNGLPVPYYYDVVLFQFNYYFTLFERGSFSVELIPKPQFNISKYKVTNNSSKEESGFEFGLNIGFSARKSFQRDNMALYLLIGFGPHYVSGVPKRQAKGFIFSDNIVAGADLKMTDRLRFDMAGGIRHISNAGLKRPNGGVNNIILYTGFIYLLNK